jgi:hypothetical protein
MSIVDDFCSIGSKLSEIERKPVKSDEPTPAQALAASISQSWMYAPAEDTAPSEILAWPMVGLQKSYNVVREYKGDYILDTTRYEM